MQVHKALVLSAHTDDGEMGCGATVSRLLEDGAEVYACAFSTGNPETGATQQEWQNAAQVLGLDSGRLFWKACTCREFTKDRQRVLDFLILLRDTQGPFDVVFCPSRWDRHQDHEVVRAEARRAFPRTTLLGYELIGACEGFVAKCLWPVERRHVERKWAALACYTSQTSQRAYMRREIVWGLATIRGMQAGVPFAEGYEVIRWVQR